MLKLFDPNVTEQEVSSVKEVLLSHNWASGAGLDKVKEFEDEFCKYLGTKAVVTVNSGTATLILHCHCFLLKVMTFWSHLFLL